MTTQIQTISCGKLAELCEADKGIELIDVRTPIEFREVHSVYARNVPLDSLGPQSLMSSPGRSSDQPVYLICRSGKRAEKACDALITAGCTNVVNVEGGTIAVLVGQTSEAWPCEDCQESPT